MGKWTLTLAIGFLVSQQALACLWQNSNQPYWPSNEINVCFIKPKGEFSFEMSRARVTIERAFKAQLNKRTPFEFKGFGFCREEDKSTPGVHIALSYGMGGGMSAGIGPSYALDYPNLTLDYISLDPSTQKPTFSATSLVNATLHETLHLFGFLHDTERTNKRRLASLQHHNPVMIGDYDKNSVLVNPNTTVLSDGDVKCLQMIANKKMGHTKADGKKASIENVSLDLGN